MKCYPVILGDYFTNHEIWTPSLNKQDSMESIRPVFFRGSLGKIHQVGVRNFDLEMIPTIFFLDV